MRTNLLLATVLLGLFVCAMSVAFGETSLGAPTLKNLRYDEPDLVYAQVEYKF